MVIAIADTGSIMDRTITFCATGRTGLGHLRRVTNVAWALRARRPRIPIALLTNGWPNGLSDEEIALYSRIEMAPRPAMAERHLSKDAGPVVVDTAVLPKLHTVDAPLCLILRETVPGKLRLFRLEGGRPWDLVILPHPAGEWTLDADLVPARRIEAVGWIYRRPARRKVEETDEDGRNGVFAGRPTLLIASGGGGQAADAFRNEVGRLIGQLRAMVRKPVTVIQAVGPHAPKAWRIPGIDAVIRPGARLHDVFVRADLIVSTAGYNAVLELACTDVPTLLVPRARTFDDQEKRARQWGKRIGFCHTPSNPRRSVRWMAEILDGGVRRPPVKLGPSGALACATLIEGLLA